MNKKKYIQNHFEYLREYDFKFNYSNDNNSSFYYCFSSSRVLITLYEDYTHQFINLKLEKDNIGILRNLDGYSEMRESIEKVYSEALMRNMSIYDSYFRSIIEIYSKFIEANLGKIMQ